MGASLGNLPGFDGYEKIASVFPEVESVDRPGWKSVVSEPLDVYTDRQTLWFGFLGQMKKRRDTYLELDLGKFFIVSQLVRRSDIPNAPSNVPTHEYSPPGQDFVALKCLHYLDRQQRAIRIEATIGSHIVGREYFVFHEVPELCVEAWRETPGERFAGTGLHAVMQWTVDLILYKLHQGEAKPCFLHPNIEEPAGSGLHVVVSDPLEDLITFERLWHEWLDLIKYPNNKSGAVKEVKLQILSDTAFSVLQIVDGAQAERYNIIGGNRPGTEVRDLKKVEANEEAKHIYIEHFIDSPGETTPQRYWVSFIEQPNLRVIGWGEKPGKRFAEASYAGNIEFQLNTVLKEQREQEKNPDVD